MHPGGFPPDLPRDDALRNSLVRLRPSGQRVAAAPRTGLSRQIVSVVLDGDRSRVRTLPFTAGALLIFGGRETLHRVSRVNGPRPRLVPVLTYAERPGLENSRAVRRLFRGRTGTECA